MPKGTLNFLLKQGLAEETGKTNFDAKNKVLLPKADYEKSGSKKLSYLQSIYCSC